MWSISFGKEYDTFRVCLTLYLFSSSLLSFSLSLSLSLSIYIYIYIYSVNTSLHGMKDIQNIFVLSFDWESQENR
jgi:hypothetical protein